MNRTIIYIAFLSILFACNDPVNKNSAPEKNILVNHTRPDIKSEACIEVFDSATAYFDMGDYATAQKLMQKCNEMEPGNGTILSTLGSSYFALRDTAAALEYFFKAISADSMKPEAYAGAGCVLEMQGKYVESINVLQNGFSKTTPDQFTHYNISLNLAVTYLSMDSCLKAKEYIEITKAHGFDNAQFDGRIQQIEEGISNRCK